MSASLAPDDDIILKAEGVGKVFPGTVALHDVDFEVRRGAVNVLVGENGAGKSTLMKILAGATEPSTGRLLLRGQPVSFQSVRDAAGQGIGIIYQELNLCPNLSVAENLSLIDPPTRFWFDIDRTRQVARAKTLLARLEHPIDPNRLVDDLRIGQQQIVEIAKALASDVDVLIMDEPTSALSAAEVEILFKVIRDLKAHGVAIIYISHRLEEIMRIGDYITVLRDGRRQADALVTDISVDWIIERMVGSTKLALQERAGQLGGDALTVRGLSLPRAAGGFLVDHVDLFVRAGEIVCLYGLLGAGRSELFECLMGQQPQAIGRIEIGGRDLSGLSIADRIKHGLVLVPEDRQRDGLVQTLSVRANLSLASLRRFTRLFALNAAGEKSEARDMIKRMIIKVSSPEVEVTALSGGNQQKVVIGKSLMTGPSVILLDEPSRGVDVGAKAEIFKLMRQLSDAGLAVVFSTSDLKEALGYADRIVVMSRGQIAAEFARDQATEAALVEASTAAFQVQERLVS
ncbi:erythritol transport system ATP-binding protein [Bradyrhizobium sp. USDA 4471]